MPNTITHPRLIELAGILLPMIDNAPARPTFQDRNKLLEIREKIRQLKEELDLGDKDEADRQYLYVEANALACEQEDFYKQNRNQWEPVKT